MAADNNINNHRHVMCGFLNPCRQSRVKGYEYRRTLNIFVCLGLIWMVSCKSDRKMPDQTNPFMREKAVDYQGKKSIIASPDTFVLKPGNLISVKAGKAQYNPLNTALPVKAGVKLHKAPLLSDTSGGAYIIRRSNDLTVIPKLQIIAKPEIIPAKDRAIKDRNPYNFSSFGKLQGLKHNVICHLIEDKDGCIWISTTGGGATKYDGKFFTHFSENQGLINNSVNRVLEDSERNIWFGTEQGLSVYNGLYIRNFSFMDTIGDVNVKAFLEDEDGKIWIGTNQGLLVYEPVNFMSTQPFSLHHYVLQDEKKILEITDLYKDNSNNIWIATSGSGVFLFNGKNFINFSKKNGFPSDNIECITRGKDGMTWFGSNGDGLISFDGDYFRHYTSEGGFKGRTVFSVQYDHFGNLWVGTLDNGLFRFDGQYFLQFTENEGLNSNDVICILNDKTGNIWLGTDGAGLNLYQGFFFSHITTSEGLSNDNVFSIATDDNQKLWLGTFGGGAVSFDGKGFYTFNEKNGFKSNRIYSVLRDKKGNLWFGTVDNGLVKYDGKHFIYYTEENGLCSNNVLYLTEDRQGHIWVGSRGGGVSKFIPDKTGNGGTFYNYTTSSGLSDDIVFTILESKKGDFWFGTGKGLSRMVNDKMITYGLTDGFSDKLVLSALESADGSLWFGTMGDGVFRFDGSDFTCLNERKGLSNDVVLSMVEDKKSNLWMGTRNGLTKLTFLSSYKDSTSKDFAPNTIECTTFGYDEGFLGIGTWRNSIMMAPDQTIIIGANDRLTIFNPLNEPRDSGKINLQFRSVDLFNEQINWLAAGQNKDTSLVLGNGVKIYDIKFDSVTKWGHLPSGLSLAFDNNFLTFHFLGIATHRPGQVKYQYKLEGLDKNWSAVTSEGRCSYGYVPPGQYVLRVKAMNSEGVWCDEVRYAFSIRPPWWLSPWAYMVYFVVFISLLWWFDRFQRERLIRSERIKAQENELKQAKEIEKAYRELKSTQAQLIQSEKMASLGELTAGIAHEIQNPLNFVNNFSEVSNELIFDMVDEVDKGNYGEVKAIAIDVQQNLTKINHHGKRASDIVKGMLEHSRTSSGKKEPTDINKLADEYLKLAYQSLRAKDKDFNATMETHFDPNLPKIDIIPQDIGRVVLNLINNAFYAVNDRSKKGEKGYQPTVSITTQLTADTQLLIAIKDNGSGIPDAIKDKIFQPFFTTKPTGQGTGLGLSLSYDIVKAHGGGLKVETKENDSTVFTILLPIH